MSTKNKGVKNATEQTTAKETKAVNAITQTMAAHKRAIDQQIASIGDPNVTVSNMTAETFEEIPNFKKVLTPTQLVNYIKLSKEVELKTFVKETKAKVSASKYKGKYLVLGEILKASKADKTINFFQLMKLANSGDNTYDVKTLDKDVNTTYKTLMSHAKIGKGLIELKLINEVNVEIGFVLNAKESEIAKMSDSQQGKLIRLKNSLTTAVEQYEFTEVNIDVDTRDIETPRVYTDARGIDRPISTCNFLTINYGVELLEAYLVGKGISADNFEVAE